MYSNYKLPSLDLLNKSTAVDEKPEEEILHGAKMLLETLESFGITGSVIKDVEYGPSVIRYILVPGKGVKVNSILKLADDIALALATSPIRIEGPTPGRAAIGIEIPRKKRAFLTLRELAENEAFLKNDSKTALCIGKSVDGTPVYSDIANMPHLLIAGATGMGKSTLIHSLVASILYKARPDEVKLIMIDPTRVELTPYDGLPHLLVPTITDTQRAIGALIYASEEMERRYDLFEKNESKNLDSYNKKVAESPELGEPLPKIIIIIDELNDLMVRMRDAAENYLMILAQKARAAGIHLVISTQRPSVDVITAPIKANIPSRIALKTSSCIDSRVILEQTGAEQLLGHGDMIFSPIGRPPERVQGAFVSCEEIKAITSFIKAQAEPDTSAQESVSKAMSNAYEQYAMRIERDNEVSIFKDEKFFSAVELAIGNGTVSTAFLQRKLHIGYARAAEYIDNMENLGIVTEKNGAAAREVLINEEQWDKLVERLLSYGEDEYTECSEDELFSDDSEKPTNDEHHSLGLLRDDKFLRAVDVAIKHGVVRTGILQRHVNLGYAKAAKYIDAMYELGIVSRGCHVRGSDVIITAEEWKEKLSRLNSEPYERKNEPPRECDDSESIKKTTDPRIAVLLANGFEEIEALTPIDMLRRAGVAVDAIGIGSSVITGAHGIQIIADITDSHANASIYDAVIFPGGMPGATNLDAAPFTDTIIASVLQKSGRLAAICAAPLVLGRRGLLNSKKATCYPGFENELKGAAVVTDGVVTDGNITTARGMGVALDFAKELVSLLVSPSLAEEISKAIMED